ncbi:Cortactin-binding protein 2, partial [Orchesella cincta]
EESEENRSFSHCPLIDLGIDKIEERITLFTIDGNNCILAMNHHQERNKIAAERRKLEEDKLQLKREREEFENMKKKAHLEREDHRNKMINFNRAIRRGTEFVAETERRIHEEEQREQALLMREEVLKVELKAKLDRNMLAGQILKRLHEQEEK